MTEEADRGHLVRLWIQKAEEDMRSAEFLMTMPGGPPFATVCFHSQQAVEKYLKAALVARDIPFPKIHDIAELVLLLPVDLRKLLTVEESESLSDHAVVSRYPGDWGPLTRAEAEMSLTIARRVRAALEELTPPTP